ncbi:hypothetical protein [Mycolicibacter icosiumassiliensis]|uniref:hypothetical protein n=1 Tax=Mycolicibacter icosiumassiliensis TaxID=1792835 RepID=UPI001F36BAEB|nr:hypothetical protein [Mycolicibacter icosiumassiliensis]
MPPEAQSGFAADVLQELLRYISMQNAKGDAPIFVSHAWTDASMMFLVYKAPPSDITSGLARDTRKSILDPIPWHSLDEAVFYYYYELDLCEDRLPASFLHPGDPTTILWSGNLDEVDPPEHVSDIPDDYCYTPPAIELLQAPEGTKQSAYQPEPRRYYDPRQLPEGRTDPPPIDLGVQPDWLRTGYTYFPYAAQQSGQWWVLRFNVGFPEHEMYTLFVDGHAVVDVTGSLASPIPFVAGIGSLERLKANEPLLDPDTAAAVVSVVAQYAGYGSEHNDPCMFCAGDRDGMERPRPSDDDGTHTPHGA